MTADQFQKLALRLNNTSEQSHMGHPDFRVNGRIFATLFYPDEDWAMVKLTPEQQQEIIKKAPDAFVPANGTSCA